jgi:hypothetical protein
VILEIETRRRRPALAPVVKALQRSIFCIHPSNGNDPDTNTGYISRARI